MCILLKREPNHKLSSQPSVDRGTRGAVDNSMKPGGVHAQIGNNAKLPDVPSTKGGENDSTKGITR